MLEVSRAPRPGSVWVVTPCKGRLAFLQQTAPRVLEHPAAHYCLVDYSCPDQCGDWFEGQFPAEIAEHRAVVERVQGQQLFSKSKAHNLGARRALAEGAEYLCFLDADTLVNAGFLDWTIRHLRKDCFLVAGREHESRDVSGMTGLLVVHGEEFLRVGGFDESFAGWGGEDVELRLRLCLVGGLDFDRVPASLTRPIQHGNDLRTEFYEESSVRISNSVNMRRVRAKVAREWQQLRVRNISDADPLWPGRPPRLYELDEEKGLAPQPAEPRPAGESALRRNPWFMGSPRLRATVARRRGRREEG